MSLMLLVFGVGFLSGCLSVILWAWRYYGPLSTEIAQLKVANLKEQEFFQQRINDLSSVHENMKQAFAAVSQELALKNADLLSLGFNESIDRLLKTSDQHRLASKEQLANVVGPLKESLLAVDKKVSELESSRQGAYSGLKEQIDSLLKSQNVLHAETNKLSRALSAPTIRGRWGEMQLRRVVELSGLSQHCDFTEQCAIKSDDEYLRPDMVVNLPKNKKIVIDAKAPLESLMNLEESSNNNLELVAAIKRHINVLKKKNYQALVGASPEFMVMFLPGESVLSRALVADRLLLDFAAQNEIILATPLTLIAILKAVAFSFKQDSVAANIEEVRALSQQLIDRISVVATHFDKLGKHLKQAGDSYNQTLASLDSRVLVTARKLSEIGSINTDSANVQARPSELELKPKDAILLGKSIEL